MFTTGRAPYPGLDPRSVIRMLDSGERLDKPSNLACNQEMYVKIILIEILSLFYTYTDNCRYNFMLNCWEESPQNRPHFADIVTTIEKMMVPLANYMEFSFVP